MAILISGKVIDFRTKKMTRTERYIIKDKRVNPPRQSNPKCICRKQKSCKICEAKLTEQKREIDKSKTIVGDFSTLLNN